MPCSLAICGSARIPNSSIWNALRRWIPRPASPSDRATILRARLSDKQLFGSFIFDKTCAVATSFTSDVSSIRSSLKRSGVDCSIAPATSPIHAVRSSLKRSRVDCSIAPATSPIHADITAHNPKMYMAALKRVPRRLIDLRVVPSQRRWLPNRA